MPFTEDITAFFSEERNGVKLPAIVRGKLVQYVVDSGVDDVDMVHLEDTLAYVEAIYEEEEAILPLMIVRRVREWAGAKAPAAQAAALPDKKQKFW